jgi:hypothetical protein
MIDTFLPVNEALRAKSAFPRKSSLRLNKASGFIVGGRERRVDIVKMLGEVIPSIAWFSPFPPRPTQAAEPML